MGETAPPTAKPRRLPARYELKYVVPESLARRIILFASAYCDRDSFLGSEQTQYTISTLYMDGPNLPLHWDKKVLRWDRLKIRIRTYGERADGPVFLELKRRYGDIVSKTRTVVPKDLWPQIVKAPTALDSNVVAERGRRMVEDFCVQCERYQARPVVIVRYDREPFVGRHDQEIRVTFDRAIRFVATRDAAFVADDREYHPLVFGAGVSTHEPRVVLELKFNRAFPHWMQQLVERFDLDRGSFSKYGRALDQMEMESLACAPTAHCSTVG